MGSMRTWSLAAVAGIFIVVVAHQRSSAEGGQPDLSQGRAVPTARGSDIRRPRIGSRHRFARFLGTGRRERSGRGQHQRHREGP